MLRQQYDQAQIAYNAAEVKYNTARATRNNAQTSYDSASQRWNAQYSARSTAAASVRDIEALHGTHNDTRTVQDKVRVKRGCIVWHPKYVDRQELYFNLDKYNRELSAAKSKLETTERANSTAATQVNNAQNYFNSTQTALTKAEAELNNARNAVNIAMNAWRAEEKRIHAEIQREEILKAAEEAQQKLLAEERIKLEESHKHTLLSNISKLGIDILNIDFTNIYHEEILQIFADKYSMLPEETRANIVLELLETRFVQAGESELLMKALEIGVNMQLLMNLSIERNSVVGIELLLSNNVDFAAKIISIANDKTLSDDIKNSQIEFLNRNLPKDSESQIEAEHQLSIISDQKNDYDMLDVDISEIELLGRESIGHENTVENL